MIAIAGDAISYESLKEYCIVLILIRVVLKWNRDKRGK
jgi:hypothetical protein